MKRWIIGVLVVVVLVAVGMVGAQTRPAASAMMLGRRPGIEVILKFGVRMKLADSEIRQDVRSLLNEMINRDTPGGGCEVQAFGDEGMIVWVHSAYGGQADAATAERLVGRLKEILTKEAMTAEQRKAKAEELGAKLEEVRGKREILHGFVLSQGKLWPDILAERVKTGELEKQRLQMDLVAKDIRNKALRVVIDRIRKEVDEKVTKDVVAEQLKKVLSLKQAELQRTKAMYEAAAASISAVEQAEAAVAEAQVRLVARREQLQQSAGGELLGKLTGELAMLMVDLAEIEGRLAFIKEEVPPMDLKTLDEAQLKRAAERYKGLYEDVGKLPPLYFKLDEQARELERQRLGVLVVEVKEVGEGVKAR